MTEEQRQHLLQIIASIPRGRVVSYGQVAEIGGMANGARQVGFLLRSLPKDTKLPWHRILNAQGKISLPEPGASLQKERLEAEGIECVHNQVSMRQYRWSP